MSTINIFLDISDSGQVFVDALLSNGLSHDGVKRRSGRFPWGKGDRPYQHDPQKRELYLSVKQDGKTYATSNGFSKKSADVFARTVVDNWNVDINSIRSGDNFENSNKEIYSIGRDIYEKRKYSSPVFNDNPSNEELNAIKNRIKLERDVQDTFDTGQDPKSKESNQNGSETTKKDPWARTEKGGKDKPNVSLAERTARDVKSTTDDLINGTTKILNNMKSNRKMKNNAKGLSNDELRERIARIRLEKEYNQLTANDVNTGYDKTMRVLNTLGTAVSVGAGVVSIVAGVKNMKSVKK